MRKSQTLFSAALAASLALGACHTDVRPDTTAPETPPYANCMMRVQQGEGGGPHVSVRRRFVLGTVYYDLECATPVGSESPKKQSMACDGPDAKFRILGQRDLRQAGQQVVSDASAAFEKTIALAIDPSAPLKAGDLVQVSGNCLTEQ